MCVPVDALECSDPRDEFRVGDVVLLSCSVQFKGYMAPSLTWTDGSGNILEAVYVESKSNVS